MNDVDFSEAQGRGAPEAGAPKKKASGMDQVNSFFNQVKTGATAAANSAQIAAEKAKLQAEISLLRNKVKTTKKDMGLVVYDALAIGDSDETQRVFNRFKLTVDGFESQIAEKMGRIEALDYQQR